MMDNRGSLVRYDLKQDTSARHTHGPGRQGEEGVFVPRANAKNEDEGWLLSYVYDANSNESELVIVDTRNMEKEPVARVKIPERVPFGFHGAWIPERAL